MLGSLPARLKTELFVYGLPARKCGSAMPKHLLGQTRQSVSRAQRSRQHSAPSARLEGAFRAVSPIGALLARPCSTYPGARVALLHLWRAVSAHGLTPTNERRNFARQP